VTVRRLLQEVFSLALIVVALPLVICAAVIFFIPGLILFSGARIARRRPVPAALSPEAGEDKTRIR
jgi:hypothetical protein